MNNGYTSRGVILEVPFKEKDEAKRLGAWWDPDLKKWFVPQGKDPRPFIRWFPDKASGRTSP
jgi:hypothetical protein